MKATKNTISLAVAACILLVTNTSQGAITINIVETMTSVDFTVFGSIDLLALGAYNSDGIGFGGFDPNRGAFSSGTGATDYYNLDVTNWATLGTGGFGNWTSSIGDTIALRSDPMLGLPDGYFSGTAISSSGTASGSSLATLGLTPGSYVTTLTNGVNIDTVTVNVISAVPEPSSMLFGVIGLSLMLIRRRSNLL